MRGDLWLGDEMIGGRGEGIPYQVQLCVGRNAQAGEVRRLIKVPGNAVRL